MIIVRHTFNQGEVFGHLAQDSSEARQLETLIREVTMISKTTEKTGLWICAEFSINNMVAVILSLNKRVVLNAQEVSVLEQKLKNALC